MEWLSSFALKFFVLSLLVFGLIVRVLIHLLHLDQILSWDPDKYGTIADWAMIIVTLFAGVFAYRTYKTQSEQLKLQQEVKEEQLFQILIQDVIRLTDDFPKRSRFFLEADDINARREKFEVKLKQDAIIGVIFSRLNEISRLSVSKVSFDRVRPLVFLCMNCTIEFTDFSDNYKIIYQGSNIKFPADWFVKNSAFIIRYYELIRKKDESKIPKIVSYCVYYIFKDYGVQTGEELEKLADKYSPLPPENLPEK